MRIYNIKSWGVQYHEHDYDKSKQKTAIYQWLGNQKEMDGLHVHVDSLKKHLIYTNTRIINIS